MRLSKEEFEDIKATILERMVSKNIWGGKHMDYKHLSSGFPSHLIKKVSYVADKLIKEGLIIKKPARYGLQVCLNINKRKEILDFLESTT
jgi:hypothetical protein